MYWVIFLLAAWAAAGISCGRLCLAAAEAARQPSEGAAHHGQTLTLYEAAFLAGGPHRVTDLTLVSMHRARRLLLAHTGWTTVVDPDGRDDLERSVIGAVGPAGQARTAAVRSAAAATEAVRTLADRLVRAGLAVPDAARTGVGAAMSRVRGAILVVLAASVAALLLDGGTAEAGMIAAWFSLPLALLLGCLAIARIEIHPCTKWASPLGQRLLDKLVRAETGGDRASLTAVAVRGPTAVDDPQLRAALLSGRPTHRGQ
ncbi:TIGR04222 domain-containing membrane protein [Streptomyces sp. NBC_00344]|uniref:TIGR04222 domain-containing membrane protein n=1 Tax=Streptomyces sp. NBC_00344 TaxID=2975720 RepID=UPI002E214362